MMVELSKLVQTDPGRIYTWLRQVHGRRHEVAISVNLDLFLQLCEDCQVQVPLDTFFRFVDDNFIFVSISK